MTSSWIIVTALLPKDRIPASDPVTDPTTDPRIVPEPRPVNLLQIRTYITREGADGPYVRFLYGDGSGFNALVDIDSLEAVVAAVDLRPEEEEDEE